MDFVIDGLETGRGVRSLTIIDSYTRECLRRALREPLHAGQGTRR
jgi:hypothetical protein